MRNIFVDDFMIHNFYLSYIFYKTYQEKFKKSENFYFYLE